MSDPERTHHEESDIPDFDEIDWGPVRECLEDGEPCPECGYPFGDDWDERHVHGGPSLGEDWIYECPGCEQETCVIGI